MGIFENFPGLSWIDDIGKEKILKEEEEEERMVSGQPEYKFKQGDIVKEIEEGRVYPVGARYEVISVFAKDGESNYTISRIGKKGPEYISNIDSIDANTFEKVGEGTSDIEDTMGRIEEYLVIIKPDMATTSEVAEDLEISRDFIENILPINYIRYRIEQIKKEGVDFYKFKGEGEPIPHSELPKTVNTEEMVSIAYEAGLKEKTKGCPETEGLKKSEKHIDHNYYCEDCETHFTVEKDAGLSYGAIGMISCPVCKERKNLHRIQKYSIVKDKYREGRYLLVDEDEYIRWHGTKQECIDKLEYIQKHIQNILQGSSNNPTETEGVPKKQPYRTTYDLFLKGEKMLNFDTKEDAEEWLEKARKEGRADVVGVSVEIKPRKSRMFQMGDMWRDDFDYEGMIKTGTEADISWGTEKLRTLFNSYEDVNYHSPSSPLWETIQDLEKGNTGGAMANLANFREINKKIIDSHFEWYPTTGIPKTKGFFEDLREAEEDILEEAIERRKEEEQMALAATIPEREGKMCSVCERPKVYKLRSTQLGYGVVDSVCYYCGVYFKNGEEIFHLGEVLPRFRATRGTPKTKDLEKRIKYLSKETGKLRSATLIREMEIIIDMLTPEEIETMDAEGYFRPEISEETAIKKAKELLRKRGIKTPKEDIKVWKTEGMNDEDTEGLRGEKTKEQMIRLLKQKGFPILFIRGEADGYYGIKVVSETEIIGYEYADDYAGKEIHDLSLVDLAHLLETGLTPKDKDYKDANEMFLEQEIEEYEELIEKYKSEAEEKEEAGDTDGAERAWEVVGELEKKKEDIKVRKTEGMNDEDNDEDDDEEETEGLCEKKVDFAPELSYSDEIIQEMIKKKEKIKEVYGIDFDTATEEEIRKFVVKIYPFTKDMGTSHEIAESIKSGKEIDTSVKPEGMPEEKICEWCSKKVEELKLSRPLSDDTGDTIGRRYKVCKGCFNDIETTAEKYGYGEYKKWEEAETEGLSGVDLPKPLVIMTEGLENQEMHRIPERSDYLVALEEKKRLEEELKTEKSPYWIKDTQRRIGYYDDIIKKYEAEHPIGKPESDTEGFEKKVKVEHTKIETHCDYCGTIAVGRCIYCKKDVCERHGYYEKSEYEDRSRVVICAKHYNESKTIQSLFVHSEDFTTWYGRYVYSHGANKEVEDEIFKEKSSRYIVFMDGSESDGSSAYVCDTKEEIEDLEEELDPDFQWIMGIVKDGKKVKIKYEKTIGCPETEGAPKEGIVCVSVPKEVDDAFKKCEQDSIEEGKKKHINTKCDVCGKSLGIDELYFSMKGKKREYYCEKHKSPKSGREIWGGFSGKRLLEVLGEEPSDQQQEPTFTLKPCRKIETKGLSEDKLHWICAVLTNDETSTDDELVELFMKEGYMSTEEARFYVSQRNRALSDPLHFELEEMEKPDVCPKCGSNDITIEGIATGVPTSEYHCNKCGHSWSDDATKWEKGETEGLGKPICPKCEEELICPSCDRDVINEIAQEIGAERAMAEHEAHGLPKAEGLRRLTRERVVFPKSSFQDPEFERIFSQIYNNSTLTEHDAYREAWKEMERLEKRTEGHDPYIERDEKIREATKDAPITSPINYIFDYTTEIAEDIAEFEGGIMGNDFKVAENAIMKAKDDLDTLERYFYLLPEPKTKGLEEYDRNLQKLKSEIDWIISETKRVDELIEKGEEQPIDFRDTVVEALITIKLIVNDMLKEAGVKPETVGLKNETVGYELERIFNRSLTLVEDEAYQLKKDPEELVLRDMLVDAEPIAQDIGTTPDNVKKWIEEMRKKIYGTKGLEKNPCPETRGQTEEKTTGCVETKGMSVHSKKIGALSKEEAEAYIEDLEGKTEKLKKRISKKRKKHD